MPIVELNSLTEEKPGLLYHMTDAQLRSRQKKEEAAFIAEGPKVVLAAINAGCRPLSLLMRRKFIGGLGEEIIRCCGDIPVYTADDEILSSLTGFRLQRAWVLAAMRRPRETDVKTVLANASRIAVLENITEPSNVGAIFRSACALGMDAVLLSPACCDPLHRRSVRVSMGAVFRLPWARFASGEAFPLLHGAGFMTAALALKESCLQPDDPALQNAEHLAIFLGTEDTGLLPETIASCDYAVKIPMSRGIDSLNVAAAASIAFWEMRDRKRHSKLESDNVSYVPL